MSLIFWPIRARDSSSFPYRMVTIRDLTFLPRPGETLAPRPTVFPPDACFGFGGEPMVPLLRFRRRTLVAFAGPSAAEAKDCCGGRESAMLLGMAAGTGASSKVAAGSCATSSSAAPSVPFPVLTKCCVIPPVEALARLVALGFFSVVSSLSFSAFVLRRLFRRPLVSMGGTSPAFCPATVSAARGSLEVLGSLSSSGVSFTSGAFGFTVAWFGAKKGCKGFRATASGRAASAAMVRTASDPISTLVSSAITSTC